MKAITAVALALSLISAASGKPAVKAGIAPPAKPEVYPIRFHMVHVHYGGRHANNTGHGEGQANVVEDGQPTRGYDFTFTDCLKFDEKFPHDLPGRWTGKEHYQLILLRTDLGASPEGPNKEECILHGIPRDFKYVHEDGKLAAVPLVPSAPPK